MDTDTHSKPESMVMQMAHHPAWTEADCIDIFWRLLIMGWLDPSRMSVAMAGEYGRKLAHYGRLALARRGHENV